MHTARKDPCQRFASRQKGARRYRRGTWQSQSPARYGCLQEGWEELVLMANSSRGVMKISTDNIKDIEAIETKIADKAGLSYETIDNLQGSNNSIDSATVRPLFFLVPLQPLPPILPALCSRSFMNYTFSLVVAVALLFRATASALASKFVCRYRRTM